MRKSCRKLRFMTAIHIHIHTNLYSVKNRENESEAQQLAVLCMGKFDHASQTVVISILTQRPKDGR